jgi:holliday junction DNA helicase RuvB
MAVFKKLIEIGAKMLDILDDSYFSPIPDYTNFNSVCTSCELGNVNYPTVQDIEPLVLSKNDSIFEGIVGYEEIKREFMKALNASSPVSILLCGPPGCGKSEFLKQIRKQFEEESVFIDGSYGSKAGIFEKLYQKRPKYVLLDEIDKLFGQDQLALLNLMDSGKLTKTTRSESYEIKLNAWVFATANNKVDLLEPLFDRFETYSLTEYTDNEFREIAARRLRQEGVQDEELTLYIANSVLGGLNRKSLRDAIRIARKCKKFEDVDETVQSLKKYGDLK